MNQEMPREQNKALFLRMMGALGRKDWNTAFACMTEDVCCDWPYLPIPDMPHRMVGRDAVRHFFDAGQAPFAGLNYQIDQVFELLDPQTLIVEYRSDSRHLASGLPYRNSYLGILRFRDGQVCYWREYINPQTITELQKAVEASTSHEHDEA